MMNKPISLLRVLKIAIIMTKIHRINKNKHSQVLNKGNRKQMRCKVRRKGMRFNNSRILFRLIVRQRKKLRKRKKVILSIQKSTIKIQITDNLSLLERMKGFKYKISRMMQMLLLLLFSRLLQRRPLMARNQ